MKLKLNIGCGTDYRENYVNIDGSNTLHRVDKVIDIGKESLLEYFEPNSIEFILANDIVEHLFHWEAIELMKEFHKMLIPSGIAEIRVPDTARIMNSWFLPIKTKITMMYGGQDIAQGNDPEKDASRQKNPQYFCHKYGWTRRSMKDALLAVGFSKVTCKHAGPNFIARAEK